MGCQFCQWHRDRRACRAEAVARAWLGLKRRAASKTFKASAWRLASRYTCETIKEEKKSRERVKKKEAMHNSRV
jgi:hypothetical protein